MTPELYAQQLRPHLLAAPAELLLDALPPLRRGGLWLEVGAGAGALTGALSRRLASEGARLIALDPRSVLLESLLPQEGLAGRVLARMSLLPVARASLDGIVGNLLLGSRAEDLTRIEGLASALRPGGHLVMTALLRGAFDEVLDLLIEVCETEGLPRARAAFLDAREDLPRVEELAAIFEDAHVTVEALGVEERVLRFDGGAHMASHPFVRDVLVATWLRGGRSLPPAAFGELARAADAYLGPGPLPVQVRVAVARVRRGAPAEREANDRATSLL